jgi:hypothetical protein
MEPYRPTVSRETRLLLTIVLISLSMLWVLARIRFPGRSSTPNPVAPVLAQLAPPSALEDIASAVAQLAPRLEGILSPIEVQPRAPMLAPGAARDVVPALRVRDGMAVALTDEPVDPQPAAGNGMQMAAHDSASGLAVFRVPADDARELTRWSPRGLQYPRFLIAADVSRDGAALHPVFIGSLDSVVSPLWDGPIWATPQHADLHQGAFVFTVEGEFAGLVIERQGGLAIVPGDVVIATAARVMQQGSRPRGWIGVEVQPLSQRLASALGATLGALVSWVDPRGPAAGLLSPTDVVEQIDGTPVVTTEYWDRRTAGLAEGDAMVLIVRRGTARREVRLTAGRSPAPPAQLPLGLSLRTIARVGAEVLRVDPESAAGRATLRAGDVVAVAGDIQAPTAAQLTRLFAAAPDATPVILVVQRGETHHVVALEKKP